MVPAKEFKTPSAEDRERLARAHLAQWHSLVNERPTSVETFMASDAWTAALDDQGFTYEQAAREVANEISKYQGLGGFIELWRAMFGYFFGGVVKNLQGKNSQTIQDNMFDFAIRANLLLYWAWSNRMFWRYDYFVRRGGLGLRYQPEHRLLEVFFGRETMSIPVDFLIREVWIDIRESIGLHLPNYVHGYLNVAAGGVRQIPPRKGGEVGSSVAASAAPDESNVSATPASNPEPPPVAPPAQPTNPAGPTAEELAITEYFGEPDAEADEDEVAAKEEAATS